MIQYIVEMKRKHKILFNFWLSRKKKIQKHMKLFSNKERKKGKLKHFLSSKRQLGKRITELKLGSKRGQPAAERLYVKIKL